MQINRLKLKILPLLFLAFSFSLLAWPKMAYAHAFGQQYNLPVPFYLYAWGAGLAIAASFGVIAVFVEAKKRTSYKRLDISSFIIVRFFRNQTTILVLKLISFLLFLLTLLSGFFGTANPVENFSMTFFWIIFVLGITYATFFFGNFYSTLNPWKALTSFIEKIIGEQKPLVTYPKSLGYWPAILFYFLFIWIELFGRVSPMELSLVLLNYSILNIVGWFVLGKKAWFEKCEFFSVFFGLISALSLVEKENGKTYLRPPFIGAIKQLSSATIVPFIIFMLSSTAFDGFKETKQWYDFYFNLPPQLFKIFGDNTRSISGTLGLIAAFLLFFSIYYVLTAALKLFSRHKDSTSKLLLYFASSLIPIALAYNLAHYYTLLLIQGQAIISLISDPFGLGWNLFGTKNYAINIALVDTNSIWHSQVAIILLGHIAAVYVAHLLTLNLVSTTKKALVAQLPTLLLMICYTVAGLWILSQPLTSGF